MLSNIFIYYIGGDLDLSITMTLLSSAFALVFTPLWLQIIPLVVNSSDVIEFPYKEILETLAAVVISSLFGCFIHWLGKVRKKITFLYKQGFSRGMISAGGCKSLRELWRQLLLLYSLLYSLLPFTSFIPWRSLLRYVIYRIFYPVQQKCNIDQNHIFSLTGSAGLCRASPLLGFHDILFSKFLRRLDIENNGKRVWCGSFAALDDRR